MQPNGHHDPDKELRDKLAHLDANLPPVELGDIVRLKQPYQTRKRGTTQDYTFGIVAEVLHRLTDGRVRNVSLYLYTAEGQLYMGPNKIPEFVDHHGSELELYKRATDDGYTPLAPRPW